MRYLSRSNNAETLHLMKNARIGSKIAYDSEPTSTASMGITIRGWFVIQSVAALPPFVLSLYKMRNTVGVLAEEALSSLGGVDL